MRAAKFVLLPGAERDALVRLLEGMRPGSAPSARGWAASRRSAVLALQDIYRPLDEALALRVDRLVRQGQRASLGPLGPAVYGDLRERMGAYLDDVLDELAVRPNVHDLVRRAA